MGRNKMPQAANSIQEPLASTGDDDKGTGHDGKGKGTVDDANGGALYRYQWHGEVVACLDAAGSPLRASTQQASRSRGPCAGGRRGRGARWT